MTLILTTNYHQIIFIVENGTQSLHVDLLGGADILREMSLLEVSLIKKLRRGGKMNGSNPMPGIIKKGGRLITPKKNCPRCFRGFYPLHCEYRINVGTRFYCVRNVEEEKLRELRKLVR